MKGIGMIEFEKKDIVRHPLVQRIVDAYEQREKEDTKEWEQSEKSNDNEE